jgi:tetratricopeptide (TPR) repeat protein
MLLLSVPDRRAAAWTLRSIAELYLLEHNFVAARKRLADALTAFEELRDKRGIGYTLCCCAVLLHEQGRLQEAIHISERGAQMLQDAGDRAGHAWALVQVGSIRHGAGDVRDGQEAWRQAHELYRQLYPEADMPFAIAPLE